MPRSQPPARRLRLLVVISSATVGGAERYAVRVARDAAETMEVVVAHRPSTEFEPLRRELAGDGIRLLTLPRGQRLRGMAGFLVLCALLRPDVVHVTLPGFRAASEIRIALAILRRPTVVVHALVPPAHLVRAQKPWFYRWTERRGQRWVAVSAHAREQLSEITGVARERITVIRNDSPVVRDRAGRPRAQGRDAVRARHELGAGPVVVSVGRLAPEKGHDVLVAAAATLAERLPGLRVLVAGEGPDRDALAAQIDAAGLRDTVALLGGRSPDEIAELLAAADAFAFPSRMEGLPLALLEAVDAGVPAVATRFGGVEEVITDPRAGRIVDLDDAAALARELGEILDDPQQARDAAAQALAAAPATPSMLDETRALLRTVAAA